MLSHFLYQIVVVSSLFDGPAIPVDPQHGFISAEACRAVAAQMSVASKLTHSCVYSPSRSN